MAPAMIGTECFDCFALYFDVCVRIKCQLEMQRLQRRTGTPLSHLSPSSVLNIVLRSYMCALNILFQEKKKGFFRTSLVERCFGVIVLCFDVEHNCSCIPVVFCYDFEGDSPQTQQNIGLSTKTLR